MRSPHGGPPCSNASLTRRPSPVVTLSQPLASSSQAIRLPSGVVSGCCTRRPATADTTPCSVTSSLSSHGMFGGFHPCHTTRPFHTIGSITKSCRPSSTRRISPDRRSISQISDWSTTTITLPPDGSTTGDDSVRSPAGTSILVEPSMPISTTSPPAATATTECPSGLQSNVPPPRPRTPRTGVVDILFQSPAGSSRSITSMCHSGRSSDLGSNGAVVTMARRRPVGSSLGSPSSRPARQFSSVNRSATAPS